MTEAELVGVNNVMNFVVWSKLFFDWQFKDYNPSEPTSQIGKTNVLLQDNTSAIQLERYGKRSSTKRTRHMETKHFAIQHWVDTDLLTLHRISTSDNESDAMTKNLPRTLFYRHIDYIMGKVIPYYVNIQT